MPATLDDVLNDVTAETTLVDSLGVFIQGLKDQITAAGGNQAKIDAIFAQVEANKQKISDALAAGVTPPVGGRKA